MATVPRLASIALLVVACSAPPSEEPAAPTRTFAELAASLAGCPDGDAPWRPALAAAQVEQKLEALLELADACAAQHPDGWEPAWVAGESLLRLGRTAEAQPRFERGREHAEALADDVGIACTANRTGALAFYAGQLPRARADYEAALTAALDAGRTDLESFVRNNLAGLLVETGEFPRARSELELAERGLAQLGLAGPARGAAFNRGMIQLALGDANGARRTLERVTREAEQAQDRRTLDSAAVALGNLHRHRGEWDEAIGWYEGVSDADEGLALRASMGLGRVALERGDHEEAAALLGATVERAGESMAFVGSYARVFQADAEARAGRTEVARELLDQVIAAAAQERLSEAEWAARWNLGRLLLREGDAIGALGALEQAVSILEAQSAALNPLGQGLHFLRLRADPYVDLAAAVVESGAVDSASRVLGIASRAQARALRHALRDAAAPPVAEELASLQASLAPDEVLIDYLVGAERGVAIAVSHGTTRIVAVPGGNALWPSLREYRSWLREPAEGNGDAVEARVAGVRLRAALIDPFADLLAASRRLYVVPDRELALLPFAALPAVEGDGYLGDSVDVAFLPMAAAPPAWQRERSPVLLGGQPELSAEDGFDELPWSAYELSRLAELWGDSNARLVSGAQLTVEGLRAAGIEGAATLHLATHAVASTRDPQRCGVILSGETLDIDAILGLELPSSLVVLSACRTGEGELLPGEGVVGLGWAFLQAGASAIVVSQWTVDDAASARLMIAFHRGLQRGDEPVAALSQARRELAREKGHPAFWAPFVIVLRPGNAGGHPTETSRVAVTDRRK